MAGLWRYNEETKGGKYLVLRRDGTVPEWPYMVLGAKDPAVPFALRAYADEAARRGFDPVYVADIRRMADEFYAFRAEHGEGDPDAPKHRHDDPTVVKRMLNGA